MSCAKCRAFHYSDAIMSRVVSQITAVSIVYSIICSSADQIKHQSSASPTFVRGIHRWPEDSPYKGPVRRNFISDDVIMWFPPHLLIRAKFANPIQRNTDSTITSKWIWQHNTNVRYYSSILVLSFHFVHRQNCSPVYYSSGGHIGGMYLSNCSYIIYVFFVGSDRLYDNRDITYRWPQTKCQRMVSIRRGKSSCCPGAFARLLLEKNHMISKTVYY